MPICTHADLHRRTACEGELLVITCGTNRQLRINSAWFRQAPSSHCNGSSSSQRQSSSVRARDDDDSLPCESTKALQNVLHRWEAVVSKRRNMQPSRSLTFNWSSKKLKRSMSVTTAPGNTCTNYGFSTRFFVYGTDGQTEGLTNGRADSSYGLLENQLYRCWIKYCCLI